ncbi:P27 family phage terminase small subunit, partial [Clostridium botulinum]
NELKESKILSNLDVPMLVTVSRAIDRLNYIESEIDNDITLLTDTSFMSTKDKYTKDLYRCCNELCLSPQSRAKMGNIALDNENKKQDPLAQIMEGVNDED